MNRLKQTALRVLGVLLVIQLAYLVLFNLALQLPLTQDLVNKIRPEKFRIAWGQAWTPYPFRVHASDVFVNGQSRTQQWQVRVDSGSGSIALFPLVLKRVRISNVNAENVEYYQRPRLKPDRDYTDLLPHFPPIEGREVIAADTSPRKNKRPWKVSIEGASASGKHSLWIFNVSGDATGNLAADLAIETRGGPFSLDAHDVDLQLQPAYLNGENKLFDGGQVTGRIGFAPFVPRENRGLRMLAFLQLETGLDLKVGSLRFINLFTGRLGGLRIDGAGQVRGQLNYDQGYIQPGTDVTASARELAVNINAMDVAGEGTVRIRHTATELTPLGLDIDYDDLVVTREQDSEHFLEGGGLSLHFMGSNLVLPDPGLNVQALLEDEASRKRREHSTLRMQIEEATLVNVAVFNDYMPASAPLKFTGGTASLQMDVFAGVKDMSGGIQLDSSAISMRMDQQDITGDLAVDLVVAGGVPRDMQVDLSGSSMTLDRVSVVGEKSSFDETYWSAVVRLVSGEATLLEPRSARADTSLVISDTRPVVALFDNNGDPPRWLSRMLTMTDIEGEASIALDDDQVLVPHAQVNSDTAEVAAKVLFHPGGRDGVVYARYKKLDVLLKMMGKDSDLDVIKVREKYDVYPVPALK